MGKSKGPGLKKAMPKTIELPLSYVLAGEAAVDALALMLDEAPTVENLRTAIAALKKHVAEERKLSPEARKALDIWD
jgi:hypothetical protein